MEFLFSRWSALGVIAAVIAYYSFQAGNEYGAYARAYREVVAELEDKNKQLDRERKEDEKQLAELAKAREDAAKAGSTVQTCKATKDQAKKINAVRE